ncbi:MAG: hypothetical protein QOG82_338 [Actinomycetota bacterium]|jgi:spore germination protein GerM|nr:hypothetical protein [Actinomycetota bacterium]
MRHRLTTTALALALLATAAACGGGGGSVDAGSTPTRPSTTTGGGTATTAPDGTSATTTDIVLYLTRGEKIVKVTRAVPKVTRIGAETVKALVGGPTAAEAADGLDTAIPEATRFRDLTIADGVAKVDLSKDFESGGGSLSLSLRLAQVTCTLDQFESVSGVRFILEGDLVNVFSGNGIVLDEPVGCADYAEFVDATPPATATFPGIWPFTSQAEMDDYLSGTDRTFTVPVDTAKAFGVRYLGMGSPASFGPPTPVAGGLVEVKLGFTTGEGGIVIVDPQPSMSVFLLSGHADGDQGPWTVVRATSPQIVVTEPTALDRISSPVPVRGQAATFEGNVLVEVRDDGMLDGANLGFAPVTGRGDGILGDFSGDIAFTAPSQPAGAMVLSEKSAIDGHTVRATVVRVAF